MGIQSASGQYTSLGREFFITLYSHNGAQQFALVSKHNTTVNFHFFADPSYDFSVALTGGTVEIIELTGDLAAISNLFASDHIDGDIDNKSLQITSDEDINVIHLAGFLAVEDASLIYPVQQPLVDFTLDTFYTVNAFMEDLPVSKTSTMIVSHYDCVTIEITPSAAYLGISAGVPFTVTLDKGETYTFADTAFNTNLSGSRIRVVSSLYKNPISVYAAQDVVYIAYPWLFSTLTGICCVDRIYEQLLPVQTFGTTFHVVPPFYGVLDDPLTSNVPAIIKIISSKDDNKVYINGTYTHTLQTGEIFDTAFTAPAIMTSEYPIGVNQFCPSHDILDGNMRGDPDQLLLKPLHSGIQEAKFKSFNLYNTPTFYPIIHILTLIGEADGLEVHLNGSNINSLFSPFPSDPTYVYAQFMVDSATQHHLTSSEDILAYFSSMPTNGASSSYSLGDIAPVLEFDNTPFVSLESQISYDTFCDNIVLKGRYGASGYIWNTGATTSLIEVDNSSMYWVTSYLGCDSVTDTFISYKMENPDPFLNDTIICSGTAIHIDYYNPLFHSYLWSTGHSGSEIVLTEEGTYWIIASTTFENCRNISDTITIQHFKKPELSFPEHLVLCDSVLSVELGVYHPEYTYQWNTGDTNCCIQVSETGVYEVTVSNHCGDTIKRQSRVEFIGCDHCINVPTAFSPNRDGINDAYTIVTDCVFSAYQLTIYNRWGQAVFISYSPDQSWDGTFNGVPSESGVYFFHILAVPMYGDTRPIERKGDLTLLR